jgi:short chain dehydrogenase
MLPGEQTLERRLVRLTRRLGIAAAFNSARNSRGAFPASVQIQGKMHVMAALNGKTAVITGGATSIGRAAARRFIEEGAFVFIFGRRQEALDAAVAPEPFS